MAKCSFHSEKEAVEKCTICGKEMCEDCAPKYLNERVACPVCSKESNRKERNGYIWIILLYGLGIIAALAVITLLTIMIVRDGEKDLFRNIGFMIGVVVVMGIAIFFMVKSIASLNYYNKRYQIALNYEKTALTTTSAETLKEEEQPSVTTTMEEAPKNEAKAKATTTAKAKKPATAKAGTKAAAKTATADVKKTTTSTTKTVKTTSKPATTAKKEVKPAEKKATTTAKSTSATAKKAAVKKSTTTK